MFPVKAIVVGALAGLAGAAGWALIASITGYEVGWIAWGIGALVGAAVRWGTAPEVTQTGDAAVDALNEIRAESDQTLPGVLAAAIAIAAVVLGKYLAVMLLIGNFSAADLDNEELVVSYLADELVAERMDAGQAVNWPAGVDPEFAAAQSDYPPEIWGEANTRWQAMSVEEKQQFRDQTATMIGSMLEQRSNSMMLASFGMFDLLWFGLAAWTAFKIGASGNEE